MAMNPPPMKNSYQRRDFGNPVVQIVLLLIISVLFSWFILKPKYTKTMESRTELKDARDQLVQIQDDQRELNRLINELKSSPQEVELLDEALPLSGRASKVYVLLDSLVRSSGMTLSLISADDTTDIISSGDKAVLKDPYKPGRTLHTIKISTSITGTMEQFKNFLQLVETNGRVLDIETVDILGGDPETKFRVSVNAYSYENVDAN